MPRSDYIPGAAVGIWDESVNTVIPYYMELIVPWENQDNQQQTNSMSGRNKFYEENQGEGMRWECLEQ